MVPVVKALTDAVTSDAMTTTGRIHKLLMFDGTKKKWSDWHRSLKQALEMPSFAPGSDGTMVTTTANAVSRLCQVQAGVRLHL